MPRLVAVLLASLVLLAAPASPWASEHEDSAYDLMRSAMVATIQQQFSALSHEIGPIDLDERLLEAFEQVPRHAFVPEDMRPASYLNMPLPVAPGATVSQPFITAYMVHLAEIGPDDEVLQVSVGGGYEAALLTYMGNKVHALEFYEGIAEEAESLFDTLGYDGIDLRTGDSYYGWPERREFDAIIVRLAVPYIPPPLVSQIAPGGRMVVPVGPEDGPQELKLIIREDDGRLRERSLMPVRFQSLPGGMRL